MGVADNKTYKDQYHFRGDFNERGEDYPSLNGQPKINQTIKENPYRSNVEIEGGELVLQPDLSALFKAEGNKHSRGGMDVLLRPNAFVFSDFKNLSISEDEKELFELKLGGSKKAIDNTPAEVVKKNVNVKHYNTLINNIVDPYKDDLARKSSAMMLEKYIATLGNIAYIQEAKKNLPDGVPDFSLGAAPVYDSTTRQNLDESHQYMKAGGNVKAPGGYVNPFEECPCGKDANGKCLPCSDLQKSQMRAKATVGTGADAAGLNYYGKDKEGYDLYHTGTDPRTTKRTAKYSGPMMGNEAWSKWLKTPQGQTWSARQSKGETTPGTDQYLAVPPPPAPTPTRTPVIAPPPETGEVTGNPQYGKRVDWEFTPWQKISQAYNWGQFAGVRRYMPYRSRYNATYADPTLLNPEQTIGDLKGQVTQQLNALGTLSPIMRNAQASAAFGQALNAIPGIRAQYDNQNAQISNQFRQTNNQIRNNETMVNMGNDQQYYQQAIEGRKNFDNLRTFTANNAMNNVMRDVETNQKLAYNILTQNNPAYSYDWQTGDFVRNQKDIRDVASGGVDDRYNALIQAVSDITDPTERAKLLVKLEGIKVFGTAKQTPEFHKKGGKVKRNPYK